MEFVKILAAALVLFWVIFIALLLILKLIMPRWPRQ